MEAQLFQKCRSHLKIPATRRVKRSQIHTENPQTLASPYNIRPSDLATGICASQKNTPKIKYNDHFTSTNFLCAKKGEKL